MLTKPTFRTKVTVSAYAIEAGSTVLTKHVISTSFAFFSALSADYRAFGATVTTRADHVNAVLAKSAFRTVVSVSAYTVETGFAIVTQHIIRAVFAFLTALSADY